MVFLDKFLMFHMYMWFALVLGLQFQLSVVGLERTPQKDACPEVETPPDSNIKLHFLNVGGVERKCCGCNRGYYVTGLCSLDNKTDTICTRCKPGTYMDEYAHGEYRCKVDKLDACPADMILIPSQFDQAPRCDCSSGFFKTTQGKCEANSRCPPGEGVKTPGTPFQDTVCERCRSGYESPRSSAEERCRLKYELLPSNSRPTSTISETTTTFATSRPCNTSVTTGGVFLIAALSILGTLVLVAVVYSCCRCTSISKNKKKAFQEEDLEARNGTRVVNATTSLMGSSRESTLRSNFDSGVIVQFPKSKSIEIVEHVSGSPSADATTNESVLFTGMRSPSLDDLNPKSTRQQISLYDSTMNQIKLDLMKLMNDEEVFCLYRKYTKDSCKRQETYISNLKKENNSGEKLCKVFDDLKCRLGEEIFNPETLHQHFVKESNQSIAQELEKYLTEKK